MTSAACPSCGTAIDPARAPVARIRDGHVVTFCSTACADGGKPPVVVEREQTPVRAEETATSRAWFDKAEEAVAREVANEESGGVDDLWDVDDEREPSEPVLLDKIKTRGYTWDEIAQDAGTEDDAGDRVVRPVTTRRRLGKRHVLLIAGAILVGGMIIAIIETVSPSTPAPAGATTDAREAAPEPAVAPEPAEDAAIDEDKLAAAAVAELREMMQSGSPRIERDAALALARHGDQDAINALLQGLTDEPSPHARLEIAYTLARSGNARGREVLHEAVDDDQRDVRMEAARLLARLGDDAGRKALRGMLRVRTHRLGAAAALALLGDEKGLELLRKTMSRSDSEEIKTRVAVDLGAAGQQEVRGTLHEIVDKGDRVGAANALAVLGDRNAIDALVEQLGFASVRVEAAVSLRRLGAEVDLEPLAKALVNSDETGRVSAAEAILILTDPDLPAELH